MFQFLSKDVIVAILTAFATSTLTMLLFQPLALSFQLNQELQNNCAEYKLPYGLDKRIEINIEESSVYIDPVESSDQSIDDVVRLPLKKTKNVQEYAGCSVEAKKILYEVQSVYEDYITDSCADFKSVIEGRVPVPTKNGVTANPDAAKEFVSLYCPTKK